MIPSLIPSNFRINRLINMGIKSFQYSAWKEIVQSAEEEIFAKSKPILQLREEWNCWL